MEMPYDITLKLDDYDPIRVVREYPDSECVNQLIITGTWHVDPEDFKRGTVREDGSFAAAFRKWAVDCGVVDDLHQFSNRDYATLSGLRKLVKEAHGTGATQARLYKIDFDTRPFKRSRLDRTSILHELTFCADLYE